MLKNKITFRFASLVVMLAFCFVASPVMAAEFSTELSIDDRYDVSFADGIQIEYDADGGDIPIVPINVSFGEVVNHDVALDADGGDASPEFADNDFQFLTPRRNGVFINLPNSAFIEDSGNVSPTPVTPADGKNFTVPFSIRVIYDGPFGFNPATAPIKTIVWLPKHVVEVADPLAYLDDDGERTVEGKNAEAELSIYYVLPNDGTFNTPTAAIGTGDGAPGVYSIERADGGLRPVTADTFNVLVTLSEEPRKDTFTKDRFDVSNAEITEVTHLGGFAEVGNIVSTGRDNMVHKYLLTITPKYENKNDIVIKIKDWESQEKPGPEKYTPPATDAARTEGVNMLTVKVGKEAPAAKDAGLVVNLPKEKRIPKDGYLVIATKITESGVADNPENDKDEPKASARTPAQLLYNVIEVGLPNLETFLANGGIIDVVGPEKVVISEIMWGTDASLKPNNNSQWIELKNKSGKSLLTGEDNYQLIFYGPNESPPAKTAAVAATATTEAKPAALPEGVMDRVGTIDEKGAYWSIVGKGQSGRSGLEEQAAAIVAVVPTQSIISMYRVADAKGLPMNGQMASSWMQSTPPGINFDLSKVGVRVGSPGAAPHITAAQQKALDDAAAAKAKADAAKADTSVSMPAVGQIYISEIMVAGGGTLPQWIEISNGSRTEQVNLSGWTITVDNAAADADVSVGASIKFTIPEGTKIDPSGQNDTPSTVLVVTEAGRNNVDGSGQVLNLWTANQTELILAGVTKRRYSLLSDMAFQITLAPPAPKKTNVAGLAATATAAQKAAAQAADAKVALAHKAATDTAGNLGADGAAAWALPMSEEGGRSSLIRRHVPVSVGPAEPEMGTMMDSWALASDTSFAQVTHIRASSYYGAMNDVGTPGFRAGGALPVELSHFRPVRNKETGQVVITWSTQSELNNAGFFIKRSQQRDGEFKVINAAMIAGAGTTSEKQFYTFTDTTAQPNVVYYYQIEDVSLDGNRQTLTRGIRLKGHIGAAGKATTTWGDLKTQE